MDLQQLTPRKAARCLSPGFLDGLNSLLAMKNQLNPTLKKAIVFQDIDASQLPQELRCRFVLLFFFFFLFLILFCFSAFCVRTCRDGIYFWICRRARRTQLLRKSKAESSIALRQKRKTADKSADTSETNTGAPSQRFTYTSTSLRSLMSGISDQLASTPKRSEPIQPRPFDLQVLCTILYLLIFFLLVFATHPSRYSACVWAQTVVNKNHSHLQILTLVFWLHFLF